MPADSASAPGAVTAACAGCKTELAPALLVCPQCARLVHAERLQRLADEAEAQAAQHKLGEALASWREALGLLPAESRQHAAVLARIRALSPLAEQAPASRARTGMLGSIGALLLGGLTKASTLISMAVMAGVYWTQFGLRFALGLVASLYVHEMGHVFELRRYGIPATAPMFVPGFGAFVRLRQYPATPREDARVGLAGPIWGTGAAIAAQLCGMSAGWPSCLAIARVGAWLNLFNLIPIGSLDGGRGLRSLTRLERLVCAGVSGIAYAVTSSGLLLVIALVALARAAARDAPTARDPGALLRFSVLVLVLATIAGRGG
jgi:Zn-dependent protease